MTLAQEDINNFFNEWFGNVAEDFGQRLIIAILIVVVGFFAVRIISNWIERWLMNSKVDDTLSIFLSRLERYGLYAIVIISALTALGIPTTSLIAILGGASLAIGLALQDSLSNIASGVLIIFLRPYAVGDFVEISNQKGTVTEVGFFHTYIRTPDYKMLLIPNSDVMDGNIINYSDFDYVRADMVFGIGYGDDILKAKQILEEILANDERVMKDPPPIIGVAELGESSVNLNVQPYVFLSNMMNLRYDLTEQVKLRFDEEGISIPFPQRDIHLHPVPAGPQSKG
jgi:small conductance mechanosensitive channel